MNQGGKYATATSTTTATRHYNEAINRKMALRHAIILWKPLETHGYMRLVRGERHMSQICSSEKHCFWKLVSTRLMYY